MVTSGEKGAHFQLLTKSHAEQLLVLMRELYAHESIPWREEDTRAAVAELLVDQRLGAAWFITAAGEVIGYMVLTIAFSLEFAGKFALLDELYIREQWTGQGIGRETVRFAERQALAMGAHAVRLEANHHNDRAVRFYERHGFQRESRYLMTKRLD